MTCQLVRIVTADYLKDSKKYYLSIPHNIKNLDEKKGGDSISAELKIALLSKKCSNKILL